MNKILNIFKQVNVKILFLTALLSSLCPQLSFAEDYSKYIERAEELLYKSDRTEAETTELDKLMATVANIPAEKRETRTTQLYNEYIEIDKDRLTQKKNAEIDEAIAATKAALHQTRNAETAAKLNAHIAELNSQKGLLPKLADECKKDTTKCSPKCYYDEVKGKCTFCPLFATFFRAASVMTRKAIDGYSGSVYKVVIIGFAVWIALHILAFVTSPEVRDLKDLILELLTQSFFVLIAVVLLQSGAFSFLNDALGPIFNTGMRAAEAILTPEQAGNNSNEVLKKVKTSEKSDNSFDEYTCESMSKYNLPNDSGENAEGALPKEMGEGILCTMGLIQNRAAKVKALGSSSICFSWEKKVFIIPHLGYLLVGIGLWVGGMLILLAVPFMMIDSVLQLAVAGSLLPFAIGAYAFKATRQYTGKVWETFINAMFAFVFVSLIALMITTALEQIVVDALGKAKFPANVTWSSIFTSYNIPLTQLLNQFTWFSTAFLEVCFVLILAWAVIGEATDFAKQFSGSITSTKIGSSIGTMAGSFTKSAATKVLDKPVSAAADKAWDLTKNASSSVVGGIRQVKMKRQADRIKKNGTYDATTGTYTINTKSWLLGRSKTLQLSETADGRKTVTESKVKKVHNWRGKTVGTNTVTQVKNKNFNITTSTIRDKDGNITSYNDEIKANSPFLNNIFEKNGAVNQENYNKALEAIKGQPNEEQLAIALQKQIMNKAMPNTKMNMKNHAYVSQKAVRDDNGNIIGFEEVHPDGSKTFVKMHMANGRMMTEMTQIDKKGRGTNLATDGVINRKRIFTLDGDIQNVNMNNWEKSVDEESVRDTYGYSAYYDYYNKTRRYSKLNEGLNTSIFSEDEIKTARSFAAANGNEMAYAHMYEFERYNG